MSLQAGTECTVELESNLATKGIVQAQLVNKAWKKVAEQWKEVEAGNQTTSLTIEVPSDAAAGNDYFWQILVYDRDAKMRVMSKVLVDFVRVYKKQ